MPVIFPVAFSYAVEQSAKCTAMRRHEDRLILKFFSTADIFHKIPGTLFHIIQTFPARCCHIILRGMEEVFNPLLRHLPIFFCITAALIDSKADLDQTLILYDRDLSSGKDTLCRVFCTDQWTGKSHVKRYITKCLSGQLCQIDPIFI